MSNPLCRYLPGALVLLLLPTAGCQAPQAWGEANSIIVAMPGEDWQVVETEVYDALEPRIFTVRDERMFDVTHADPRDERWPRFREFRRVLVVGHPDDEWLQPALRRVRGEVPPAPTMVQAENVWARNQTVTIALLPPDGDIDALRPMLDDIGEQYRADFRRWARERMYVSGVDTTLANRLQAQAGFSILLPEVYRGGEVQPGSYLFRNDYPQASRLTRSILVTWRDGTDPDLTAPKVLRWREDLATQFYDPPHVTETDQLESAPVEVEGGHGVQVQGVWASPEGAWPAAGPFMSRVLSCPDQDRVYFVDAWLYAPGRGKHEYMIQLRTILDTFRCGEA